jgi:hypothetical protein
VRSYQIQDIKDFMKKLLIGDTFDTFLLCEASITTFASFQIDGHFHPEYLHDSETETAAAEQCGYVLWKRIRPFFFELTRGRNTPLSFRIVFRLAPHNVEALLAQSGIAMRTEDVDGLFLNLSFDGSTLTCTSGTSLNVFSLDKTLDHAWDSMLEKFFRQKEIPFL